MAHLDHGLTPAHLELVNQIVSERNAFFAETFELPPALPDLESALYGPTAGDPPVAEDDIFYACRGSRAWTSRLILKPNRPTRKLTVIGGPDSTGAIVLYTAFGGTLSPQEPGDPTVKNLRESIAFWSDHALTSISRFPNGSRVELAPHLDMWMQGDRYGDVIRASASGTDVCVRMDKSNRKVWLSLGNIRLV